MRAEHHIHIQADQAAVYAVLADVARWALYFPPTVWAERTEGDDSAETIRVTAMANGKPRSWQSRRALDEASHRITFEQVLTAAPVAAMSGSWSVQPDPAGGCAVVLDHEYRSVGDSPAALEQITRAVNANSQSELAALKRAAEYGPGLNHVLVEFCDSEEVDAPFEQAYEFIRDASRWAEALPHVTRINVDEYDQGMQVVDMDTRAPDGSVHTTVSARICTGSVIRYKQTRAAEVLHAHVGAWEFEYTGAGKVKVTSRHAVIMNPQVISQLPDPPADLAAAAQMVRNALGGNSRATISILKERQNSSGGVIEMTIISREELAGYLQRAVGGESDFEENSDWQLVLSEMGFDSLAAIDLGNKIEKAYGITFPEAEEVLEMTADDLFKSINEKIMLERQV
jgi:aromatase